MIGHSKIMQTASDTTTSKNNRQAITSLGISLVGIVFMFVSSFTTPLVASISALLGIAALVTGFKARKQIEKSGGIGDDIAIAGMVLGGGQLVMVLCGIIFTVGLIWLGPQMSGPFSSINDSLK